MDSLIRWKRQDSIKLTKAINHFNNQISKLDKNKNIPSKITYDEARDRFVTRREFEILVKSLNRADEKTLTKEVELASGEKISYWEYSETLRKRNIAGANLLNELDRINRERAESGNRYMGEERITEIQETLNILDASMDDLASMTKNKKRFNKLGRTDYQTYRNKIFRDNFMKALKDGASNFDHYEELVKVLNGIKNPNKFYEYVSKSSVLSDIFLWYKEKENAAVYSSFETNEQAFNYALKEELGLDIKEE